jgi:hypothetical protein
MVMIALKAAGENIGREIWAGEDRTLLAREYPDIREYDHVDRKGIKYAKIGNVNHIFASVKVPIPTLFRRIEYTKPNGKIGVDEGPAHSWTRNFYNWFTCSHGKNISDATNFQDGNLNVKDTTGSVINGNWGFIIPNGNTPTDETYGIRSGIGTDTWGLQVGSGASGTYPETFDDYILGAIINTGTSAGQLVYSNSPTPIPSWTSGVSGGTWAYTLNRFFDNYSGGTITVKEIGLVTRGAAGNNAKNVMVARDSISDLSIANNQQARLNYTISMTYSNLGPLTRMYYNLMFMQHCAVGNDYPNVAFGDGSLRVRAYNSAGDQNYAYIYSLRTNNNLDTHGTYSLGLYAQSGVNYTGAAVGTGSTAFSFDDRTLATLIAHGTGSSQMSYSASETITRTWSDPTMTIRTAKTITNNSAASITVNEIGFFINYAANGGYTGFLIYREVLGSPVTVIVGDAVRPILDLVITYP